MTFAPGIKSPAELSFFRSGSEPPPIPPSQLFETLDRDAQPSGLPGWREAQAQEVSHYRTQNLLILGYPILLKTQGNQFPFLKGTSPRGNLPGWVQVETHQPSEIAEAREIQPD